MKLKHKINIFFYHLIIWLLNLNSGITIKLIGKKVLGRNIVFDFERTYNSNFPKNKELKFIQIGGNDGISFDGLYEKLLERKPKGIILEPSPKYFKKLQVNYKNFKDIILLPFAIFEKKGTLELFELNEKGLNNHPSWAAGIGSVDINHLFKLNVKTDEIDKVVVEGITFDELIATCSGFKSVDYLQIDTEGYDFEILKTINLDSFSPKMIKFEFANLTPDDKKGAISFLQKDFFIFMDDIDIVGMKKNLKVKCRI